RKHDARVWLVNTGWTGGPYGVGHRMSISHTRAMLRAALEGRLDGVPTTRHPVFGLEVPREVPGVPADVLDPRQTWPDQDAYDRQARKLAGMFAENFRQFEAEVSDAVRAAGPAAG
ncbi:MAG TPA: phosphoenolpyruvate carboxykinase (ATP), partial [Deinococcales bacterium]|nr:phosphoenolpyruvate carboxykinase (ATP) [Deinococcales bacterium]